MAQQHTFSGSGRPPSPMQRGLSNYDRDTIAYLSQCGVADIQLERVMVFDGTEERQARRARELPNSLR